MLLVMVVIVALFAAAWQSRIELLFWAAPLLREAFDPVAPNIPIRWTSGPTTAIKPPAERPPNIVLILADDLGFNDVSLTGGGAADGTLMTPNIDLLAHEGVTVVHPEAAAASLHSRDIGKSRAPIRRRVATGRQE